MTQQEKLELMRELQQGGLHIGRDLIMEMNGDINNYERAETNDAETCKPADMSAVGKAIKSVQDLFWGQSAYAVIFCVMRDCYGYEGNASLFEDAISELSQTLSFDYACPENTISSSFHYNTYLKKPISTWGGLGVKKRVLTLVKEFQKALASEQEKE